MMVHNVKFVDLFRAHEKIMPELNEAIQQTIDASSFIGGSSVDEFEKDFSHFIGTRYCEGVASGSDALYISLKALDIGPGDEVIVPSFTFTATVDAVVRNGATPVFVDAGNNYNMDPEEFSKAITPRTKAVIPVHLYGNPAKLDEICEVADDKGVLVIEDAAQSHGSRYKGKRVGSFGILSCYSFYPAKNLGAFGDGGAICTNSSELDDRIRMIREYGQRKKYHHDFIGMNSRLDALQAAILRVKLKHLDKWNSSRRKAAQLYNEFLSGSSVELPEETESSEHIYHIYAIRAQHRDEMIRHLQNAGIATGIHYPIPVHNLNSYKGIGTRHKLDNSERFAREELSLPMFPFITEEEVEYVSESVKKFTTEQ